MKRKDPNSAPCKIYTFGILGQFLSKETKELINHTLFQKHRHMCNLIEAERARRTAYREARGRLFPIIAKYEAEEDKEARKAMKEERAAAVKLAKTNEELKLLSKEGMTKLRARIKELRKDIFWGNYLLNEKAFESVVKKTGDDPRFKRFDGTGRIGAQVPALTNKHIYSSNDQGTFKIGHDPVYKRAVMVRIQVASGGRKNKTWVEVPVIFHRPLPPDAQIAWAWIKVTKAANKTRYELQLTINSGTFRTIPIQPARPSVVALDIGWRSVREPNGEMAIRYAMFYDGKKFTEHRLKPSRIRYPDNIRSVRDSVCLSMRKIVWSVKDTLPPELTEFMSRMADPYKAARRGTWQSSSALFKMLKLMKEFGTEHLLTPWLIEWNRKDIHLWQWEANQRRKSLASRRDQYRCILSDLAKRYDYLIVEDFKTGEVIRKTGEPRRPNLQRITVAPHEFLLLCKSYFPDNRLIKVSPINTTRECNFCHHINEAKKSTILVCAGCGEEYDCDINASANIFDIGHPMLNIAAE